MLQSRGPSPRRFSPLFINTNRPVTAPRKASTEVWVSLKPSGYWSAHGSPHSFATFPHTPLHRRVLIHLGVLEIFPAEFLLRAELLVLLILLRPANICQIAARIREHVIGFLSLFDHGHLSGRKILELLLLGGRFRSDDFKAGDHQHAFS